MISTSSMNNHNLVPREFLEQLEHELTEAVKLFLDVLLVKSELASTDVLGLRVKLKPWYASECQYLPEVLAKALELCEETCGVYSADTREIVVFLGCLGRDRRHFKTSISTLEYTLFHLIVHHIQSTAPHIVKQGFRGDHYAVVDEADKSHTYSVEVEADYLTRIFSFISEEERLNLYPQNKYFYELWQPLRKGMWRIHEYCKKVETRTAPSPSYLDPSIVCYNPFRWLISHTSRVLGRARGLLDVLTSGLEISATLVNRVGLGTTEPLTGLYIDEKSICFSAKSGRLYICYNGNYLRKIRGAGHELGFNSEIEVDLKSVIGLTITFHAPRAKVRLITPGDEKATEARIYYRGSIPRPPKTPATIDELRKLVETLVADIPLPPGFCDVEKRMYVIALPMMRAREHAQRRELVLEVSEALIPVDDQKLCIEAEEAGV